MYSLNRIRNALIFVSCVGFSFTMSSYQTIHENMKKHPEVVEYYKKDLEDNVVGNYIIEREDIKRIVDENKKCATTSLASLFVTSVSLAGLILTSENSEEKKSS